MTEPHLYSQMFTQMRQWINPTDRRHLQGFSEAVSRILQAESGCPSHLLPYLSHRNCNARNHLQRLHDFLQNPAITAARYYEPPRPAYPASLGRTIHDIRRFPPKRLPN